MLLLSCCCSCRRCRCCCYHHLCFSSLSLLLLLFLLPLLLCSSLSCPAPAASSPCRAPPDAPPFPAVRASGLQAVSRARAAGRLPPGAALRSAALRHAPLGFEVQRMATSSSTTRGPRLIVEGRSPLRGAEAPQGGGGVPPLSHAGCRLFGVRCRLRDVWRSVAGDQSKPYSIGPHMPYVCLFCAVRPFTMSQSARRLQLWYCSRNWCGRVAFGQKQVPCDLLMPYDTVATRKWIGSFHQSAIQYGKFSR